MAVPPQSAQHNWVVGSNRAHPLFLKAEKTKLVPTACDRRQSPLASIEMFTCPTYRPVRVTANPMLTLGAVDSGKRQLTARICKIAPHLGRGDLFVGWRAVSRLSKKFVNNTLRKWL